MSQDHVSSSAGEAGDAFRVLEDLAAATGGRIDDVGLLPDGSGFATMSMPLPRDHWLTKPGYNVPPMGLRMGTEHPQRRDMEARIRAAAQYAVRCATMNGKEDDIDPDALVQQMVVGLMGYFTADAFSRCNSEILGLPDDDNPEPPPAMVVGVEFEAACDGISNVTQTVVPDGPKA